MQINLVNGGIFPIKDNLENNSKDLNIQVHSKEKVN
jgi:hypothetical protein